VPGIRTCVNVDMRECVKVRSETADQEQEPGRLVGPGLLSVCACVCKEASRGQITRDLVRSPVRFGPRYAASCV